MFSVETKSSVFEHHQVERFVKPPETNIVERYGGISGIGRNSLAGTCKNVEPEEFQRLSDKAFSKITYSLNLLHYSSAITELRQCRYNVTAAVCV